MATSNPSVFLLMINGQIEGADVSSQLDLVNYKISIDIRIIGIICTRCTH